MLKKTHTPRKVKTRKKQGLPHSSDGRLSDSDIQKVYVEAFDRVKGGSATFNRKQGSEAHPDDIRAMLKHLEVLLRWELRQAGLLTPKERESQTAARTLKRYCLQALKRFNVGEVATLDQAFGLRAKKGTPGRSIEDQEQFSVAILRARLQGGSFERAVRTVSKQVGLSVPALHKIWNKNKGAAFRVVKNERFPFRLTLEEMRADDDGMAQRVTKCGWTEQETAILEDLFAADIASAEALFETVN